MEEKEKSHRLHWVVNMIVFVAAYTQSTVICWQIAVQIGARKWMDLVESSISFDCGRFSRCNLLFSPICTCTERSVCGLCYRISHRLAATCISSNDHRFSLFLSPALSLVRYVCAPCSCCLAKCIFSCCTFPPANSNAINNVNGIALGLHGKWCVSMQYYRMQSSPIILIHH